MFHGTYWKMEPKPMHRLRKETKFENRISRYPWRQLIDSEWRISLQLCYSSGALGSRGNNHLLRTGSGWHFVQSICYDVNDVTGQYDISLTLWSRCKSPPLQSAKLHWYWLYWIDYIFCWKIPWSFARSFKPIIANVWFSVIGLNIMNIAL